VKISNYGVPRYVILSTVLILPVSSVDMAESRNFSLHRRVQTVLEPTQLPIQWVPGALSLGVKQSGREADHSPSVRD